MASTDWTTSAEEAIDAACRRARDPRTLLHEVLDELHGLLSLRGSALYHHSTGGLPVFLHGSLTGQLEALDPELMHPDNDPFHRVVARLAPRPRVVHASGGVPRDVLRRSATYRNFYGEHGIDHVVCVWLDGRRPPEPGMTGMFLTRSDDDGAFEPEHFELLRNTLPILTLSVHRAIDPSPLAPSIVLDRGGELLRVSATAERCLRRLRLRPGELALRLWAPIQRWRSLRTTHALAGEPTAVFHVVERRHESLYVEVTERGGEVRLRLLDASHVPELAELKQRHGLTATEFAVLQALALGLSNTEISEYLGVAMETVKTHVRRVLAKLGLRSRLRAGLLMQRIVIAAS